MTEPRDTELQDYLGGQSELSRRYRQLPAELPPSALDEKIRAAARAPLVPRRPRWILPLSTAAVVMLSVGVLLRMQQAGITPVMPDEQLMDSAPAADQPPALYKEERPRAAPAERPPAAKRGPDRGPGVPAEQAPAAGDLSRQAEPERAAPIPQAPATGQQRQLAPAADAAGHENKAARQMTAPAADSSEAAASAAPVREPQEWLRHIRYLRDNGHAEEARQELAAFRARYPDHVLPDDLR